MLKSVETERNVGRQQLQNQEGPETQNNRGKKGKHECMARQIQEKSSQASGGKRKWLASCGTCMDQKTTARSSWHRASVFPSGRNIYMKLRDLSPKSPAVKLFLRFLL